MRRLSILMAVLFAFGVINAQDLKIIRTKHTDPQVSVVKDQLIDMSAQYVTLTAAKDKAPKDSVAIYNSRIRLLKAEIKIQIAALKAEQAFIASPSLASVVPINTTY